MSMKLFIVVAYKENSGLVLALGDLFFTEYLTVAFKFCYLYT